MHHQWRSTVYITCTTQSKAAAGGARTPANWGGCNHFPLNQNYVKIKIVIDDEIVSQ